MTDVAEYRLRSQAEVRDYAARRGITPALVVYYDKRDEGRCRMCKRPKEIRPLTRHHLVSKMWFKWHGLGAIKNCASNLIPLCWPCHVAVEDIAHARIELRRCLTPAEISFGIQVMGRGWFDDKYPARHLARPARRANLAS